MALDRTWYNALIDDDGSNTIGTVWGKDDIANLLNSVDAELARVDTFGAWQQVPFAPTNFVPSSGSWDIAAGHILYNRYLRMNKAVCWSLATAAHWLGAANGRLYLVPPVMPVVGNSGATRMAKVMAAGAYMGSVEGIMGAGSGWLELTSNGGAVAFPSGAFEVMFTVWYQVT